jgi:hypothetical protein
MTDRDREEIAIEMRSLLEVCKAQHIANIAGHATTQCHCICGSSMGGPVGNDPCRALRRIKSVLERHLPKATKKPTELQREIEEILHWL